MNTDLDDTSSPVTWRERLHHWSMDNIAYIVLSAFAVWCFFILVIVPAYGV